MHLGEYRRANDLSRSAMTKRPWNGSIVLILLGLSLASFSFAAEPLPPDPY
jgi:hypothetical protein